MTDNFTLPDPASDGEFTWTCDDLQACMAELGRQMMRGRFNPHTWEGHDITVHVAGRDRAFSTKYLGYIAGDFQSAGIDITNLVESEQTP